MLGFADIPSQVLDDKMIGSFDNLKKFVEELQLLFSKKFKKDL